jgi:hypothetical protein
MFGESVVVEVQYQIGGKTQSNKISSALKRSPVFSGRLPFDGVWYVASEHGISGPAQTISRGSVAYDFVQIGANGKSFQKDGKSNTDYFDYGKKVLAAKDGTVVLVRTDIVENEPGKINSNTPGGNVVVIDHGDGQFGYYAHLRPNTITLKIGVKVKAGDPIGDVGNSGESTEPGLHFPRDERTRHQHERWNSRGVYGLEISIVQCFSRGSKAGASAARRVCSTFEQVNDANRRH